MALFGANVGKKVDKVTSGQVDEGTSGQGGGFCLPSVYSHSEKGEVIFNRVGGVKSFQNFCEFQG